MKLPSSTKEEPAMDQTKPFIDHLLVTFTGAIFDIQIIDLYKDMEDPRRYHLCWQIVCEGQTSPQKDALLSFNDNLTSLPEMNDKTKLDGARANLRGFAMWNDEEVVSISFSDGSPNHISYTVQWHKKMKTFNPRAWA